MRRGHELRHHILFTAKDVFLEMGFERASMDAIAARADTTKRTLYAHFENKEGLFLAVVDLVRDLLRDRLKAPADYASDPTEALVQFCARLQRLVRWGPTIRMCRLGIAEAERFPEGSTRFHAALFGTAEQRLEEHLSQRFGLPRAHSEQVARDLLARVMHSWLTRALFGVEPVTDDDWSDAEAPGAELDLAPIRRAVAELVPPARAPG